MVLDSNKLSKELADQALTRHSDTYGSHYEEDAYRRSLQRGQDAAIIMMGSIITMQEQLLRQTGNGHRKRDKIRAAALPLGGLVTAAAVLVKVYLGG